MRNWVDRIKDVVACCFTIAFLGSFICGVVLLIIVIAKGGSSSPESLRLAAAGCWTGFGFLLACGIFTIGAD